MALTSAIALMLQGVSHEHAFDATVLIAKKLIEKYTRLIQKFVQENCDEETCNQFESRSREFSISL